MTDEKSDFRAEFESRALSEGVDPDYVGAYYNLVFELATGIASRDADQCVVVGIAGAQGVGKSTFAKLLAVLLEGVFEKSTLVVSLDDFYLTRAERQQLAEKVHPLLAVRGVPGTHDVALMRSVIAALKARKNVEIPRFSKADDDRVGWVPVMGESMQVVIVEGWCWGAAPMAEASLAQPVNPLEQEQDPDGDWRWYVNEQLVAYQDLFALSDALFFFAAPDMDTVVEWRWRQEQQLDGSGPAVMTRDQVREFVMYFERITRHMLDEMPSRADLTLFLDERHRVQAPRRDRFR